MGARDDARARARGRAHRARRARATLDDGTVEFTFHDAAPGEPELDLEADQGRAARARRGGRDDRHPPAARARARGRGRGRRGARASAGARYRAGRGRRARRTAVRADGPRRSPTSTCGSRSTPPTARSPSTADGVAVRGANRYVDGGDGGDTYNYSPPDGRHRRSTGPRRSTVDGRPSPARCGPGSSSRAHLPVARPRDRRRAVVHAAQRRDRPRSTCVTTSSCAPASGSCACTSSSTTTSATTGCARTSRSRRRSTAPTPSARSRSCTAGSTAEGGPHEYGLPTFVSRRFVDCSDGRRRRPRAAPRRAARVRGRRRRRRARAHAAAGHRLPVALGARRCDPTRPARSTRSRARSSRAALALDYAVLPHRGDWHDAGAARRGRRVPRAARARARRRLARRRRRRPPVTRLRVDGAEVSALLRDDDRRAHGAGGQPVTRAVGGRSPCADGAPSAVKWSISPVRPSAPFDGTAAAPAVGAPHPPRRRR